jgi:aryl-alcohol dehydrogenase
VLSRSAVIRDPRSPYGIEPVVLDDPLPGEALVRVVGAGSPAYCASFELLNLSGLRADGSRGARDESGAAVTSRWFAQSSFGEYCLATVRNMVKVPADLPAGLPLEKLGPLGCGIQTGAGAVLNQMRLAAGQSLAVFGAGAVGLAAVMAAASTSASTRPAWRA